MKGLRLIHDHEHRIVSPAKCIATFDVGGKKEVKLEPPSAPRTPVTRGSNVVAEHPAILKREILEPSNQVALQRLTNTVLDESMARGLAESETVKPESIEPA